MKKEKYQRAKAIFEKVADLPPGERESRLKTLCKGDTELHDFVKSLLAADSQAASQFMEQSALEAMQVNDPYVGKHIGAYKILRVIGRGGMGAVYLAIRDDDQYKKQVALKIIKRGMDSEEILKRFKTERQILATLVHPNIARLLDGGATEDGLPYFVMEYIQGQPIDEYSDSHNLNTLERLKLFRKVCAAVQYAHQNLIVHRDLKPSNILVGADGEPKLLDFGIAKLLNPSLSPVTIPMTATMMQVMTPEYASPEQVRGEPITTASDVYSLGVLLYELLTGHRPYQLKNRIPQEIERIICESEPLKPSTIITRVEEVTSPDGTTESKITPESISKNRDSKPDTLRKRLTGDIDNIVLTALRKEPNRRYASIEQFSEDIRRHLANLPIFARKDTAWYRSSRFIKRHKVGVIATVLVVITLLAGIVGTAWQAKVAAEERDRARIETEKAEQVSEFLVDLFEVSNPSEAKGDTITAREILERGAEKIETELKDQPEVRATMASVIGKVYQSLGLFDDAEHLIRIALDIREELYSIDHVDKAQSYNDLGSVFFKKGKYAEAEDEMRKALQMHKILLGDAHIAVAGNMNDLAMVLRHRGQYAEAESLFFNVLEIQNKLLEPNDLEIGKSLVSMADLFHEQGRFAEAESLFHRAIEIQETQLSKDHPDVILSKHNLAVLMQNQGKFAESEPILRYIVKVNEKQLGKDHPDVGASLNSLALSLDQLGRYAEAEKLYRRALEIGETQLGKDHPDVANRLHNLASTLKDVGQYTEAEALTYRALEINEKQLGENHIMVTHHLNLLASLMQIQGKYAEAEPIFQRIVEIREINMGKDHPTVATGLNNLALLIDDLERYAEAESLHYRAIKIREFRLGDDHPDVAQSLHNLAGVYRAQKRYDEAEPLFKRAAAIWEKQLGVEHPYVAASLNHLGGICREQGRYSESEAYYQRALAIREKRYGKDHPNVASSLHGFGDLYTAQEQYTKAKPFYRRALEIRVNKLGKDHPRTQKVRKSYEELLKKIDLARD